jgi:protocatechuate 3,4-dioxygenase alpha subunit
VTTLDPAPAKAVTPSQTIGPFYGYALPFPGGDQIAPAGHPDALVFHGQVLDGEGRAIPDALLEFWQDAPDGSPARTSGSLRRNSVTGGFLGRHGVDFTGFGRVETDADGHWSLRTLPPAGRTPYLAVCVFARGLLHHLYTRAYLPRHEQDDLLRSLAPERRETLLAVAEGGGVYRFDIRLQGGPQEETVFLAFH